MKNRKYFVLLGSIVVVSLFLFGWLNRAVVGDNGRQVYALEAPLLPAGDDSTAGNKTMAAIQDEAGIAGYFKTGAPFSLASVRPIYRTIETETTDYIVGSVEVEGYDEDQDVHLYVHKDGWFLAYYLNTDPVSKIMDWLAYDENSTTVPIKFEQTLALAAGAANISLPSIAYYDFRYPAATQLMLIAERSGGTNNSFFYVEIPSSFTYHELSWSIHGGTLYLNEEPLNSSEGYGTLTTTQLLPDTQNHVRVSFWEGGLAILYGVQ